MGPRVIDSPCRVSRLQHVNEDSTTLVENYDLAIIGMTGRFPGAPSLERYWEKLRDGVECIRQFNDDDLLRRGVPRSNLGAANFVKAGATLDGVDQFAATFFGYSPAEAELMDPQHRIFLECAWEALENAGYDPDTFPGLIGVYAGTSLSSYLLFNLWETASVRRATDTFPAMVGNDKDFLSTRVSYHLNLRGPSLDLQTGCSTSLVAVHLACEALLSCQCDMALAGGVSVSVPQRTGYYYHPGGVTSPDGRCRAFDARAQGTVFGSGAGIIVLRRLEDALSAGDTIYAVVKGSAVNNDGSSKAGYTAPSVDGQAEVIARAQAVAGVGPDSISYIEAHGTGTQLGDPVEIQALTKAFRAKCDGRQFCALGSVKSSIGHLDAAAGVAGLIKTTLALRHKQIPPAVSFERANDQIDFASTPFYVPVNLADWNSTGSPRRAGVSSFGIGGTNAHLIIEEAPDGSAAEPDGSPQLLLISAKTETALENMIGNLAAHLRETRHDLADIAFTLQAGRRHFRHRCAIACESLEHSRQVIERAPKQQLLRAAAPAEGRTAAFLFPGQGAQTVGMGQGLYEHEPVFREAVDSCCSVVAGALTMDLRDLMYAPESRREDAAALLNRTEFAQPALFIFEFALAKLWMSWGLIPGVMIGHSIGEYVAACIAGVFPVESALRLVVKRAHLMQSLPSGAMLALGVGEEQARVFCDREVSLAAVNGPRQCVVSGPLDRIEQIRHSLSASGVPAVQLSTSHAFHSAMMDPILETFREAVASAGPQQPKIPTVSNVTGTWTTPEQATDPHYWARQLRETVRFGDGAVSILQQTGWVLLEVGPGQTLTGLVRQHPDCDPEREVVTSLGYSKGESDSMRIRTALGRLWLCGVAFDWPALHNRRRRRVPLPTYAFERQSYWIDPGPNTARAEKELGRRTDIADWFYMPGWKRTLEQPVCELASAKWLVLDDGSDLAMQLEARLREKGCEVVIARAGTHFAELKGGGFEINPAEPEQFARLHRAIETRGAAVDRVLHFASAAGDRPATEAFFSLLYLVQALAPAGHHPVSVSVITRCAQDVIGTEPLSLTDAAIAGLCDVVPQELPHLACRWIDVNCADAGTGTVAGEIMRELAAAAMDRRVALRNGRRFVPGYEAIRITPESGRTEFRPEGVYLIAGGLGAIGFTLAEFLTSACRAKLVLIQRSAFPAESEWGRWVDLHGESNPTSIRIQRLRRMQAQGSDICVLQADITDRAQLETAVGAAVERFGTLHGVMHAAGHSGKSTLRFIREATRADVERQLESRMAGLHVLDQVLAGRSLDFRLLFSSNASVLGGPGLVAYAAAHRSADAFASMHSRTGKTPWLSINWDPWLVSDSGRVDVPSSSAMSQHMLTADQGIEALRRILARVRCGQVIVSACDLNARRAEWLENSPRSADTSIPVAHNRPASEAAYLAPSGDVEKLVAGIWQEVLGLAGIAANDNFFDLGGTSLLGARVMERLNQALAAEFPIVTLFEYPTISLLTRAMSGGQGVDTVDARANSRGARRRELFERKGARA